MKTTQNILKAVTTGIITEAINKDNYITYIDGIFCAVNSIQDNIQLVIEYGFEHYKANDNAPDVFNYLMKCAVSSYGQGIRSETLKQYIEALIVGLKWSKTNDGKLAFKKASKSTKVKLNPSVLEDKWYKYNDKGIAIPKVSLVQSVEQAIKKFMDVKNGNRDGELVNEETDTIFLNALLKQLQSVDPDFKAEAKVEKKAKAIPKAKQTHEDH